MAPRVIAENIGAIRGHHQRQGGSSRGPWIGAVAVSESDESPSGGGGSGPGGSGGGSEEGGLNWPRVKGRRPLRIWHAPDAFAFGVVLWECLTLRSPWKSVRSIRDMWTRVQRGERPAVTADEEASAPEGYVALMRELWAQDPVARPTFAEAWRRLKAIRARFAGGFLGEGSGAASGGGGHVLGSGSGSTSTGGNSAETQRPPPRRRQKTIREKKDKSERSPTAAAVSFSSIRLS